MSRSVVRFSLDLEKKQKDFIQKFAIEHEVGSAAVIIRALIYKLSTEPEFANSVMDTIFDEIESTGEVSHIVRYPFNLDSEQKKFIRVFAITNGVSASTVVRAMIYVLQNVKGVSRQLLELIFSVPPQEDSGPAETTAS